MERDQILDWLRAVMRSYRSTLQSDRRHLLEDFQLVHAARKVVGVGSVGTRAWILLMFGRDDTDPLFLAGQRGPALGARGVRRTEPTRSTANGSSTASTSWQRRATSSWAGSPSKASTGCPATSTSANSETGKAPPSSRAMIPATMAVYGRVCGSSLARAHARSGDRIAIASYLGASDAFDQALAEFAEAYADQNERDYDALVQAEKDGRITAQRGL